MSPSEHGLGSLMYMDRAFFKVMLGKGSMYAPLCVQKGFLGADFDVIENLEPRLKDVIESFIDTMTSSLMEIDSSRSKRAANLGANSLWLVCKGIQEGDIVLSPDDAGQMYVGEVISPYWYFEEGPLPHRRSVRWFPKKLARQRMSVPLQNSSGFGTTAYTLEHHHGELSELVSEIVDFLVDTSTDTEEIRSFVVESFLQAFLEKNWTLTSLGKTHDIFEIDGIPVGAQFQTETGPLDLLAVSKDKKELLVIELKKGRAYDKVLGQLQRYMGYVADKVAEPGQTVRGLIIALEDDRGLQYALKVAPNVSFMRYSIDFKLLP